MMARMQKTFGHCIHDILQLPKILNWKRVRSLFRTQALKFMDMKWNPGVKSRLPV